MIFTFIVCMFSFSCRRCSSVVEHVIGNDGVASPILASGTIQNPSLAEGFLMVIDEEKRTCGGNASPERVVGENERKTLAISLVLREV